MLNKKSFSSALLFIAALGLTPFAAIGAEEKQTPQKIVPPPSTETPAQRDARMAWWREGRFGMFIHYGLYSGLEGEWNGKSIGRGGVEWIQTRVGADTKTYADAAFPKFRPRADAAKEWAKLAKLAGCKYMVLTTKHHDGFALFDSKLTDYDAHDLLGRDLIKEYVDAGRAEGIKIGFYHSLIDWHHPDYNFRLSKQLPYPANGKKLAGDTPRDHRKYQDFLHGQAAELMSNYGKIDTVWWDYSATDFDGEEAWRSIELMEMVHEKQPDIVWNNRLYRRPEGGFTGMSTNAVSMKNDPRYGDYITPEGHIPANGVPGVDWETCMTISGSWGWSKHAKKLKSPQTLVRQLCETASKGGNFLLNADPMPDGSIPPETFKRFEAVGKWMDVNGESIYGTTASPFEKAPNWGRITQKKAEKVYYLHIFKTPETGTIEIELPGTAKKAYTLKTPATLLKTEKTDAGYKIESPAPDAAGLPVVVKVETE